MNEERNDVLSIIQDIANDIHWNRFVNEHYLHHYFTQRLYEKKYESNLSLKRGKFRVHPEWPTYRNEDVDENIMIHYRRYSGKKIEESPNKGHCGHFDFVIGDYNQPKIGIEFKWYYGLDKDRLFFDFIKCMDQAIKCFQTTISYSVVVRKNGLSQKGHKTRFHNSLNDIFDNAKTHLNEHDSFFKKSERDLYILVTEIGYDQENGKNLKRHWYVDKYSDQFIEKTQPLKLI